MKKELFSFVMLACALLPLTGVSAEISKGVPLDLEIGPAFFYSKYEEPSVMKTWGFMSGLTASLSYSGKIKLRTEAEAVFGQVEYKSRNTGTAHDENNFQIEPRFLVGYDLRRDIAFSEGIRYTFAPYLGLGYRYLNNDASGKITTTGYKGYGRESRYIYSPLGFELDCRLKDNPSGGERCLGFTCEYDLFWRGKQISRLSDADPGFNDIRNAQRKGYGLRGSVRFKSKMKKADILCEPFFRYWNIRKSREANVYYSGTIWGYGWEPKNNTVEIGSRFVLTF